MNMLTTWKNILILNNVYSVMLKSDLLYIWSVSWETVFTSAPCGSYKYHVGMTGCVKMCSVSSSKHCSSVYILQVDTINYTFKRENQRFYSLSNVFFLTLEFGDDGSTLLSEQYSELGKQTEVELEKSSSPRPDTQLFERQHCLLCGCPEEWTKRGDFTEHPSLVSFHCKYP